MEDPGLGLIEIKLDEFIWIKEKLPISDRIL